MAWVGIEWVPAYGGTANLSNPKAQAEGFYNTIPGVRRLPFGASPALAQAFDASGRGTRRPGPATH